MVIFGVVYIVNDKWRVCYNYEWMNNGYWFKFLVIDWFIG